jgi:hypothetical protein
MRYLTSIGFVLSVVLAACTQPSAQDRIEAAERAALAPLKAKYSDLILGYDFHGRAVDISVDLQAYDDMDDDAEAAMERRALRDWRSAWLSQHPHDHGVLTVRFLDFRAETITKESVRV